MKVNGDLSMSLEITLPLARIFMSILSLLLLLSQDERVNAGGLVEQKGKRPKPACITVFPAGAVMQSPSDGRSWG